MNQQLLDYIDSNDHSLQTIGAQLILKEGIEVACSYVEHFYESFTTRTIRWSRYSNLWDRITELGYYLYWEGRNVRIKRRIIEPTDP